MLFHFLSRGLGLKEMHLAEACNRESLRKGESLRMNRERVAKLLMNCKKNPEQSAAKIISYSELKALAAALSVSIERLVVLPDNHDPVHRNVVAEPQRSRHILHLLSEYEEKAGESLVYPARGLVLIGRADTKPAASPGIEQVTEDGRTVKTRSTASVNRAVARDRGYRMCIIDECIILYHAVALRTSVLPSTNLLHQHQCPRFTFSKSHLNSVLTALLIARSKSAMGEPSLNAAATA
jgi:hypothetical protein